MTKPILMTKDLCLSLDNGEREIEILKNINLTIGEGELWGIVGESGAGKSMTMYALTALLPKRRTRMTGQILFREADDSYTDLLAMPQAKRQPYTAKRISLILQDSINALNPFETVARQWRDTVKLHHPDMPKEDTDRHILDRMDLFGIHGGKDVMNQYPHQLSGGMRQRIAIAMALESDAKILICDEPTTSLDAINQRNIVEFIEDLCDRGNLTMLYITHNLGITAAICTHTAVMRNGEIIEQGLTDNVFGKPQADYTRALINETAKLWQKGRTFHND